MGAARDGCVIAWDAAAEPRVLYAAGATETVFLQPAAQLLDQPASTLFSGGERAAKDLAAAAAGRSVSEQRPMMRGGKPFSAQLLLRGLTGGTLAFVRDLAAGAREGDSAARAEDLARFASLVAHEVRNPLSAVKIALQTLERHGALAQNDLRRTSIALREVLNIELLLNEVLEFARPPSLALVPGDPRPMVEEAVAGVEAEWGARGVSFVRSFAERLPPVVIDPVRIRTATRILCRQAAAAAQDAGGGTVEVVLRDLSGAWELRVTDPGRTLPPELQKTAFVPFTPQRARGSGLGLAVVARIAREHRGEARIQERPGGGNVISLTFPA